ncbi:MAG: tRNA preQ1(34) S-adenosylmethionine ribosyltransferase-isomerase QueA [Lachnospiraceae bacterium]|jgi:S-adenosylmethionine:tRNA ribosyltransferase-isomerase|nr:tRNA preQ1(34) S-adenosylmethionine ribosyltransferase-isomerase QueA [Lachnospiraceae bacterium]
MKKSDFYFELPNELIAQDPLVHRSDSRLLVLDKKTGELSHRRFTDFLSYLEPGDCLVMNDTKVIPARLIGEKYINNVDTVQTKIVNPPAKIEVLLLKDQTTRYQASVPSLILPPDSKCKIWESVVKPGRKCRVGAKISFGGGFLFGAVLEILEDGKRLIAFSYQGIWEELLDQLGEMPLPPYITQKLTDQDRYQTVYARAAGSAAAPTAGLHFTEEMLTAIAQKGVHLAFCTLHVGLGTFRPVKEESILDHHMHTEHYEITQKAAKQINDAKKNGKRVICVGTTSCRSVESAAVFRAESNAWEVQPGSADTDIFLYPGAQFHIMDALITNFHLPESTLIMLVSAFAGRESVLHAYEQAILERYRFYSFGDAMLIL